MSLRIYSTGATNNNNNILIYNVPGSVDSEARKSGRVTNPPTCSRSGRVASGKSWVGSGNKKVTHVQLWAATWSAPFTLNNFVNFNPIYLKFGRIRKLHEPLLPCKLGKNPSRRTWVLDLRSSPIHSYSKIASSFLTCSRNARPVPYFFTPAVFGPAFSVDRRHLCSRPAPLFDIHWALSMGP